MFPYSILLTKMDDEHSMIILDKYTIVLNKSEEDILSWMIGISDLVKGEEKEMGKERVAYRLKLPKWRFEKFIDKNDILILYQPIKEQNKVIQHQIIVAYPSIAIIIKYPKEGKEEYIEGESPPKEIRDLIRNIFKNYKQIAFQISENFREFYQKLDKIKEEIKKIVEKYNIDIEIERKNRKKLLESLEAGL